MHPLNYYEIHKITEKVIAMLLLYFATRTYLFSPDEESWYVFSTRNNCSKFFSSYKVIFQSDIQAYFTLE